MGAVAIPAFRELPRMRRTRAAREYPDIDTPTTDAADVDEALQGAEGMITAAEQILATDRLYRFDRDS